MRAQYTVIMGVGVGLERGPGWGGVRVCVSACVCVCERAPACICASYVTCVCQRVQALQHECVRIIVHGIISVCAPRSRVSAYKLRVRVSVHPCTVLIDPVCICASAAVVLCGLLSRVSTGAPVVAVLPVSCLALACRFNADNSGSTASPWFTELRLRLLTPSFCSVPRTGSV